MHIRAIFRRLWLPCTALALLPAIGTALTVGRYPLPLADLLGFLLALTGL